MAEGNSGRLESSLKMLAATVALGGFLWGIWTYWDTRTIELAQQERLNQRYEETRRIEATKPFLERQLKLYTEASQATAVLATSQDDATRNGARKRFWELYWGELALVENEIVEAAMVAFGRGLQAGRPPEEMQQLSLSLAHACRDSLAISWGVIDWKRPR